MSENFTSIEEVKRKLEHYCVYQDRCHKEVEKKMQNFDLIPQVKEEILLHLLKHNFLNEERFTKSFVRGKFNIKKWGKLRIVRELKYRDISKYNIDTGLKEIDSEVYIKTLYELVTKKNNSIKESNIFKRKKKIYDYVNYRGYESHLIYEAINNIISS